MADSLLDINYPTYPLFPFDPNWASEPKTMASMTRRVVEFQGTSQQLVLLTEDCPIQFNAAFLFTTKADIYTMWEFFCARRGRCQRFWIKHPKRLFRLKVAAGTGTDFLGCYPNAFHRPFRAYERLYIRMNNGDILTRSVTAAEYNEGEDRLDLTLDSNLDRDIGLTDYDCIGRLLLCRFDADELPEVIYTTTISEVQFSFVELVQEYP